MRATFATGILVSAACWGVSGSASAGAAAPWARLVEAKPLARNALLLIEAFNHGTPIFKVRRGNKTIQLAPVSRWPIARLPSEGQGALFALRPVSDTWPPGDALTIEMYRPSEPTQVWHRFTQPVAEAPDMAPPLVVGTPFMTGQNTQTLSIPIVGKRTNRWVSFAKVDDASAMVRATLRLQIKSSGKPQTVETSFRPGTGFRVPLDPAHEYLFVSAELKDTAGNTTQIASSPATSSKDPGVEAKGGCNCNLAASLDLDSRTSPWWLLLGGAGWLARRRRRPY